MRGGRRYGAGRPGSKAKAEQILSLDVRLIQRAGMLRPGYVGELNWKNNSGEPAGSIRISAAVDSIRLDHGMDRKACSQSITIVRTRCHFGGSRPWFVCPIGGDRVAILYAWAGRFACRRCQHIAYLSQSEDLIYRIQRRQRKIEEKLGPHCERPKGMHAITFERLLEEIGRCEASQNVPMDRVAARMGLCMK